VFFDDMEVPAENLIGEEGKGLPLHPGDEMPNASDRRRNHRRLAGWFIEKATEYAKERKLFAARSARTRACSSRLRAPMRRPKPRT